MTSIPLTTLCSWSASSRVRTQLPAPWGDSCDRVFMRDGLKKDVGFWGPLAGCARSLFGAMSWDVALRRGRCGSFDKTGSARLSAPVILEPGGFRGEDTAGLAVWSCFDAGSSPLTFNPCLTIAASRIFWEGLCVLVVEHDAVADAYLGLARRPFPRCWRASRTSTSS